MAKGERAFWSSLPGALTGLAGILTASVALLGLALSQGWIGDGGGEAGDNSGSDESFVVSVEPESLTLRPTVLGAVTEPIMIRNDGSVPVTVDSTELTGENRDRFEVDESECSGVELASGRSCELLVTFDPDGAGESTATLVVSVEDGARSEEVSLRAFGVG